MEQNEASAVNSPELETLYGMMQATNSLKSLTFTKDDFIWKKKEMLRRLNVDDLPQTGLQVKVVYLCYYVNSVRRSKQNTDNSVRRSKQNTRENLAS